MKTFILLFCTTVFSFSPTNIFTQNDKVIIDKDKTVTIDEVFDMLREQTDYTFLYQEELFKNQPLVHLKKGTIKANKLLEKSFSNGNLKFSFTRKNKIIIVESPLVIEKQAPQDKIDISGIVLDEDGEPLPGASILEKGTGNGTESDFDGNFTLAVTNENAVLVISYLGFIAKEIVLNGQNTVNISLEKSEGNLEEVVIVGYGTMAKKDITGSISILDGEAITERSTMGVANAMQGAVSGVLVTRNSSAPGSGASIRIRGNTTLEGLNNPLVLIDDVPGNIEDVTPDQIESISVLKDGAASAIYGSRAAAGVIIITTKRAKTGVMRISYKGDYFINSPTKKRNYVDALQYLQMDNEKAWNDNGNGDNLFPTWSEDRVNKYISGEAASNRNEYPDTDWDDLILNETSSGHRHNLNISAGSEKVKTNILLGYEYQDALYDFRDWSRISARINNDIKISNKVGIIADINFQLTETNNPITNPTGRALQAAPIYPAVWEDGRYAEGKGGDNIYLRFNEGGSSESDKYLFTGKIGAFYKPIEDLKISLNIVPTTTFTNGKTFSKEVRYWNADDPEQLLEGTLIAGQTQNNLFESRFNFRGLTTQALINYDKKIDKHSIDVLLGFEDRSAYTEELRVRGEKFVSPDFPYLNQAPTAEVFDNGTSVSELAYTSYFGRANYNYNDKYYLSATVRQDGSSRFGKDYRWGTFPSFSASWILSNENFMNSIESISFLKLKGSYGTLGNDRLGNYLHITQLEVNNSLLANGSNVEELRALSQLYLTTPDIKWETTTSTNIGFELELLDNRFSLDFEYFNKETTDMLLSLSVPDLVGFEDPIVNVGSMTTKGWDSSISWNDTLGDDLSYGISFNLNDVKSTIGDVNGKRLFSGVTISEEGSEFREYYGYQSEGLFQTQQEVDNSPVTSSAVKPGDIKYKDISGPDGEPDGVINSLDQTLLGGSLPRYYYGGNINITYKNFDFGLSFQGVADQQFYLSQSFIRPFAESWLTPSQEYSNSYWSVNNSAQVNQNAKYPRLSETSTSNNYSFSDYWLFDGAYLRIKNISLGYTLPTNIVKNAGLSDIRLSVAGNDLFTFDNLPNGVDPEQSSGTGYYLTSSVIFGIKANF